MMNVIYSNIVLVYGFYLNANQVPILFICKFMVHTPCYVSGALILICN